MDLVSAEMCYKVSSKPQFVAAEVAEQLQTRGALVNSDLVCRQVALGFGGRSGRTVVALDKFIPMWLVSALLRVTAQEQEVPGNTDRLGEGAFANVALKMRNNS